MWRRFQQRQSAPRVNQARIAKGWIAGAIATPVLVGLMWGLWFLPNRELQASQAHPSHSETATSTHQHPETSPNGTRAIAAVVVGLFLFHKFCLADRKTEPIGLSGADFSSLDLSAADFSGANLSGANFSRALLYGANLSGADLNGANLNDAELCGANLSRVNLNGADLVNANLSGTNLNDASLRYANLSGGNFRYANLSGADFRHANLSEADLNCTLLSRANFSDANLSRALLFFTNLREVLNLELPQLEADPSPFLCHVALPTYGQQTELDANRACDRIPQLLSARYRISVEEAQWIVNEARQHPWD